MHWLWIWFGFIIVFFVLPVSWGWAFRRWGPPYPSAYHRRPRGETTSPEVQEEVAAAERERAAGTGWSWRADVVWVMLVVAAVWLVIGLVIA